MDTTVGTNSGIGTMRKEIVLKPSGVWNEDLRHAIIHAWTDVIGGMTDSYDVSGGVQRHGTVWSATMHTAPHFVHIARFGSDMQGDLRVYAELEDGDKWGCEMITSQLNALMSSIAPVLGHALGQLTAVCN